MIAGLITPTGNLGALTPQTISVKPITDVDVAVGDIVQFDLTASTSPRALAANLTNFDEKTCPFNVVKKGVAVVPGSEGGIWGVVTEAASAGNRCTVVVAGVVDAKVTTATSIAAGAVFMAIAGAVLGVATDGGNPAIAILLEAADTVTAASRKVLFNGYAIGSSAA